MSDYITGITFDYKPLVKVGIKKLSKNQKNFFEKIDLNKLNLRHTRNCPLGQIFGDYYTGLAKLSISEEDASAYGFTCLGQRYNCSCNQLTEEWKRQLRKLISLVNYQRKNN